MINRVHLQLEKIKDGRGRRRKTYICVYLGVWRTFVFYLDSAEYLGIKDMKNVFVKIAWHWGIDFFFFFVFFRRVTYFTLNGIV